MDNKPSDPVVLNSDSSVYVAGHEGMVGSALVRRLKIRGIGRIISRSRKELDLTHRDEVFEFFSNERPDIVILSAAKVGGIAANIARPVEFLLDNLKIQNNVLEACLSFGVKKTIFLGSSCIYPRECQQPMREDYLMTGPLEPTNETYAMAKLAGISLSRALRRQYGLNVICPIPCNVYGPGDHFEFERAHVMSALVRRFSDAKDLNQSPVTVWGTGHACREFLYVDDLADACLFLLEKYNADQVINIGSGEDISIRDLANLISELVEYKGEIRWDTSKPDGMPRKLLDVSRVRLLGWSHSTSLRNGIKEVVKDYRQRYMGHSNIG